MPDHGDGRMMDPGVGRTGCKDGMNVVIYVVLSRHEIFFGKEA